MPGTRPHEFAGPSEPATEAESNGVMYKIRRWSLPGSAVMPVLNVSSRVTWLELDDKSLLDSCDVLQEGILCDVFSQKCSAAWQGAPGQRLTVSIMLPGRQLADEWLDFMLSPRNLWPTFTIKGSPRDDHGANFSQRTAQIAGQASVDGHQNYLGSTIQSYVHGGSTGLSREQLYMTCSLTEPPRVIREIPMKRKHTVAQITM